jgi:hypothetical protein
VAIYIAIFTSRDYGVNGALNVIWRKLRNYKFIMIPIGFFDALPKLFLLGLETHLRTLLMYVVTGKLALLLESRESIRQTSI